MFFSFLYSCTRHKALQAALLNFELYHQMVAYTYEWEMIKSLCISEDSAFETDMFVDTGVKCERLLLRRCLTSIGIVYKLASCFLLDLY